MKLETLAVHAGRAVDPATGAVTAPIHPSTTFERDADGGYPHGYDYIRSGNPTRESFETCMTALEGGAGALAYASGMAAITSVIESVALAPGARPVVVLPRALYFTIMGLLRDTDLGGRIEAHYVDMADLGAVATLCEAQRPALVWVETPSNPLVTLTDIRAVADIAHGVGALVVADNTWATPVLTRPLEHGADGVVHSVTKYIGGHCDLLAGAAVWARGDETFARLTRHQKYKGAVPSPFDCWLALRGVQTLNVRMDAQSRTAHVLAKALDAHPAVLRVHYPGLASDPGHALAARQMDGFGAMLSFVLRGGREAAFAASARLTLITRATSLGGTHTLIEHRASIEGADTLAPEGLLRVSVGLEHADDLLTDLNQALEGL